MRLRREKDELERTYFDKGKIKGERWTKAAPYPTLRYAAQVFVLWHELAIKPLHPAFIYQQDDEEFADYLSSCLFRDPAMIPTPWVKYTRSRCSSFNS